MNCDESLMAMLCSCEVLSCICILKTVRVVRDGSGVCLLMLARRAIFFLLY